jgi:hypothetical protein
MLIFVGSKVMKVVGVLKGESFKITVPEQQSKEELTYIFHIALRYLKS